MALTCDVVYRQVLSDNHEAHLLELVRLAKLLHPSDHYAVQGDILRHPLLEKPVVLQDLSRSPSL
jgi:hypothetical protein